MAPEIGRFPCGCSTEPVEVPEAQENPLRLAEQGSTPAGSFPGDLTPMLIGYVDGQHSAKSDIKD